MKPSWCDWYKRTGTFWCCGPSGSREDKLFKDGQGKLNSELDLLEITKLLRLNRFWMTQHTTRRQRELVKYFDDYTLHAGDSGDDHNPRDPNTIVGQPNYNHGSERLLCSHQKGSLELSKVKEYKKGEGFMSQAHYGPEEKEALFDHLDMHKDSMDYFMVDRILNGKEAGGRHTLLHEVERTGEAVNSMMT